MSSSSSPCVLWWDFYSAHIPSRPTNEVDLGMLGLLILWAIHHTNTISRTSTTNHTDDDQTVITIIIDDYCYKSFRAAPAAATYTNPPRLRPLFCRFCTHQLPPLCCYYYYGCLVREFGLRGGTNGESVGAPPK